MSDNLGSSSFYLNRIERALTRRKEKGTLRQLSSRRQQQEQQEPSTNSSLSAGGAEQLSRLDFSSNDYLGLAQSFEQYKLVEERYQSLLSSLLESSNNNSNNNSSSPFLGATGSRLLSGDGSFFHYLEQRLAHCHNRNYALLCNSGYDANLSVFSCLPCDVLFYDEYIHNSIHMGMRIWQTTTTTTSTTTFSMKKRTQSFRHNDVHDLKQQFQVLRRQEQEISSPHNQSRPIIVMIAVESVYSMDGDLAPLKEIFALAMEYGASVIVDEAHALGVYGSRGMGLLSEYHLERHAHLFASIHTFGKGAGCHGAVLCCQHEPIWQYWINFAYPFIYSTALPLHSLVTIQMSYETMTCPSRGNQLRRQLQQNIHFFRKLILQILPPWQSENHPVVFWMPSDSPIQALRIAGNEVCTQVCHKIYHSSQQTIRLYPIKSPTVPAGQERIRIVLHAHNTMAQIQFLVQLIQQSLQDLDLLPPKQISKL